MKLMKHVFPALFALTLALQPAAMFGMKEEQSWLQSIFGTISGVVNGLTAQIKKHPYITTAGVIASAAILSRLLYAQKTGESTVPQVTGEEKDDGAEKTKEKEKSSEGFSNIENEEEAGKNENIEEQGDEKIDFSTLRPPFSLIHLSIMRENDLAENDDALLTPEPAELAAAKKWLWNDGMLSKDSSTYKVSYAGKTYVSTYNEDTKRWEASKKNQMSYVTYYAYLHHRQKGPALSSALENLMAFIITQRIETLLARERDKKSYVVHKLLPCLKLDKDMNENVADTSFMKALCEAMVTEEKNKDKYVFYHGCDPIWIWYADFVAAIKGIDSCDEVCERSLDEQDDSEFQQMLMDEYLKTNMQDCKERLLSVNLALDGSEQLYYEWTVFFFARAFSVTASGMIAPYGRMQDKICNKFNLGDDVKKQITELASEYRKIGGALKQIFIDPLKANEISYISAPCEAPYMQEKSLEEHDSKMKWSYRCEIDYCHFKNALPIAKSLLKLISPEAPENFSALTTKNVIEFIRTSPDSPVFGTPEGCSLVNQPQARLLHFSKPFMDPAEAKKYGLSIHYYFATEDGKKRRQELRARMRGIVKEALKNKIEK